MKMKMIRLSTIPCFRLSTPATWDKDHVEDKTDSPAELAKKSNGEFVNELVEEGQGFVDKCSYCHVRGARSEELEDSKLVRKSNLYYVTNILYILQNESHS